jgi:hypothetical protein
LEQWYNTIDWMYTEIDHNPENGLNEFNMQVWILLPFNT